MNAMAMATDADRAQLDDLVSTLQTVEQTLQGVIAARDGLLAMANRLALSVAEQSGGVDVADLTTRAVAAELGAALRVSDRTMQRRMAAASLLVERFPDVWQAQGSGRVSAGHARVIVDAGAHIEDADDRGAYAQRVLEFAEDESPNRVRVVAERVAQQYHARPLDERHRDAREKRGSWVQDHPDAMSELHIFGPTALIHGAHERLTQMAKARGTAAGDGGEPEDARTLAQRRADLALDLLLTGAPAGHDADDALLLRIVARQCHGASDDAHGGRRPVRRTERPRSHRY